MLSATAAVALAGAGGITGQNSPAAATPTPPTASKAPVKPISKPLWIELTPQQQQALSPLASEWDKLDGFRKQKWLEIGNKFSAMKPDERQRMQERMREWAKLTPEQRRVARENYTIAKKIQPEQKSAKWEQYQQLSEEQKQQLAASASQKKQVVNLPTPTQNKIKPISSVKPGQKAAPVTPASATVTVPAPPQPAAPTLPK